MEEASPGKVSWAGAAGSRSSSQEGILLTMPRATLSSENEFKVTLCGCQTLDPETFDPRTFDPRHLTLDI